MIFVDSNIFIFANIIEYPEHDLARRRLKEILGSKEKIGIDSIIISEVSYKLSKIIGAEESYKRVFGLLSSIYVSYLPIEKKTIGKALNLSFKERIRINDAIIGQHALDNNSTLLTDNLKDFKRIVELNLQPLR